MEKLNTLMQYLRRPQKGQQFSLIITLILVYAFMALTNGMRFISLYNLSSMAYQLPMIGLLSIGMMISELSGGINLSIVANTNFNGIIIYLVLNALTGGSMAEANSFCIIAAVLAGFLASALIGVLNGLLITKLNIPAILATLGTMTLFQGINLVLTRGYTISGFPGKLIFIGNGTVAGIPMPMILFAAVVLITHFVLDRSSFGKKLYMTGANQRASRFSNVNVSRVIILEYVLSACFASLTSLVMIGQMNSVKANYAESYLLVAILASFLGGVDPAGGFGRLSGMVLAAVILQLISTGLNLMRLDPFMITAMWGAIIIIVLVIRELAGFIIGKAAARITKTAAPKTPS
ncbi:MAG: ABC transporter permease [Treponema sp.]|jgi:simple sugar transport system permease protein|nr:ABC transporter permease [Treponema sp.]